jgi:phosphatidylglycerophosphatase A
MSAGSRLPVGMGRVPMLAITSGGLGLLRPAPGTWGSLPAPCIAMLLAWTGAPWWMAYAVLALLLLLGSIACIRFGFDAERAFGAKDPSSCVADETAGAALALLVVPWPLLWPAEGAGLGAVVGACAAGFLLFRAFDVWKPGAIRTLQGRAGGWGILLDDLAAALWCWPPLIVLSIAAKSML